MESNPCVIFIGRPFFADNHLNMNLLVYEVHRACLLFFLKPVYIWEWVRVFSYTWVSVQMARARWRLCLNWDWLRDGKSLWSKMLLNVEKENERENYLLVIAQTTIMTTLSFIKWLWIKWNGFCTKELIWKHMKKERNTLKHIKYHVYSYHVLKA